MKRCSIIVHSVNGNCYIIANHIKQLLEERNVEARLYRVEDPDLHIWANKNDGTNAYYEEILSLPLVQPDKLIKSDMIILGCPTIFSNVSAEMKVFMDSTLDMVQSGELEDKLFSCFTSSEYSKFEALGALDAMQHLAQAQKLITIPFGKAGQASGGFCNEGQENITIRPAGEIEQQLEAYADCLAAFIQD